MSLTDFKALKSGDFGVITVFETDKHGRKLPTLSRTPSPVCSDTNYVVDLFDPDDPEAIVCDVSYGNNSRTDLTIAGVQANFVRYEFRNQKLSTIAIYFDSPLYSVIEKAFELKYGSPTSTDGRIYENAFGAAWKANGSQWLRTDKQIEFEEGPGNGPGAHGQGRVLFKDLTNQLSIKPKIDF